MRRAERRAWFTPINEGEKGAISAIRFEGNTHFSDCTLRKQMKTKGKTLDFVPRQIRTAR